MRKYGELKRDLNRGKIIVTYRPRQLFEQGKLTMKEAQKIPGFWESDPNENEYHAVEQFYKKLAAEAGL